ncbi:hypothetical protein [Mastigocoleus testarum]|uniref:Uncharacterized protein n=1 Tax=Mastigocoleus testarum BC008 TaxID=371196 RepID=A0A0V7ZK42_9CYAN|nr:hypothetical protein [Mastigocoleus testarum]KST64070.1 hypothetical protein BC008_40465 [Mastigocoleus testarum BC008]KST64780.1 hypothetical protein BC008_41440 [Mastigocoleus testarum BC008]
MRKENKKSFWIDPATSRTYPNKKDIPAYLLASGRLQHWDSVLEFKTFQFLEVWFPKVEIRRQKEIQIYPKNKAFPKISWKIDFCLEFPIPIYIEVKGQWLLKDAEKEIFWRTLRGVQDKHPQIFNRLLFTSDKGDWKIPHTNLSVVPLNNLRTHLDSIVAID